MIPPVDIAVLDACVLYPPAMRDFLMWLAVANLYQPRWSDDIHAEWTRNVLKDRPDLQPEQLERTRRFMDSAIPAGRVSGYATLIDTLALPDPNDRHVLAAAIHSQANVIVTANLRDFPKSYLAGFKIKSLHPDAFAIRLYEADQTDFIQAVRIHRASLKNPPKAAEMYVATLQQNQMPQIAARLAQHLNEI